MATIKRFEDMEAWRAAMDLADKVYELSGRHPLNVDYPLRDQMRRCAISVFSNIAEGFERDGNREFINFLSIAKGSCGELRSQMIFAERRGYVSLEELQSLTKQLLSVSSQIAGFQRYLRQSELKGRKFAN